MPPDTYAVFGHPIGHSKSPLIHTLFAQQTGENITYTAQDVPPECFEVGLRTFHAGGGKGLNCTVPLKESAFQAADELTSRAQQSEAVNTLVWRDDKLHGDNTDGIGLLRDLTENLAIELSGRRLLVLGAGGAVRGILGPLLEQKPACLVIANRTVSRAQSLAARFAALGPVSAAGFPGLQGLRFDLILNATAAGLQGELPPLPDDLLVPDGDCYDLMYADKPTAFVRWGHDHGARLSVDGLGMLVEQAAEAFLVWRGVRPRTAPVIRRLRRATAASGE
ncbi:MAG: shikimate dehydrogenase [Methylohalobius crimeensis]